MNNIDDELEKRISQIEKEIEKGSEIKLMTPKDFIILAVFIFVCFVIVVAGAFIV